MSKIGRSRKSEAKSWKGTVRIKAFSLSLVLVFCFGASASASTFTVTNTVDPGDGTCDTGCTLREALSEANANPGADDIVFNIPGTGVHTITLIADLPLIIGPVTIDGYTQHGSFCQYSGGGQQCGPADRSKW